MCFIAASRLTSSWSWTDLVARSQHIVLGCLEEEEE